MFKNTIKHASKDAYYSIGLEYSRSFLLIMLHIAVKRIHASHRACRDTEGQVISVNFGLERKFQT